MGSKDLFPLNQHDRMLSYLPLAHVAERAVVEAQSLVFRLPRVLRQQPGDLPARTCAARGRRSSSRCRACGPSSTSASTRSCRRPSRNSCSASRSCRGVVKKKILTQLGLEHVRAAITGAAPLPPNIIELVPRPRAGAARGLRHVRELRLLACQPAGQDAHRLCRQRQPGLRTSHRRERRDPGQEPRPDDGLLQDGQV